MKKAWSLILVLTLALNLLVCVHPSNAEGPLNVDCTTLENTLVILDGLLDTSGFTCDNGGDLISTSFNDQEFFLSISAAIFAISGGTISFQSPEQMVATIGKCRLMPLVLDLCLD